jgi:hypothetical protein
MSPSIPACPGRHRITRTNRDVPGARFGRRDRTRLPDSADSPARPASDETDSLAQRVPCSPARGEEKADAMSESLCHEGERRREGGRKKGTRYIHPGKCTLSPFPGPLFPALFPARNPHKPRRVCRPRIRLWWRRLVARLLAAACNRARGLAKGRCPTSGANRGPRRGAQIDEGHGPRPDFGQGDQGCFDQRIDRFHCGAPWRRELAFCRPEQEGRVPLLQLLELQDLPVLHRKPPFVVGLRW